MRSMQPAAFTRIGSGTTISPLAVLQAGENALQGVHGHPRAVRAALAGGAAPAVGASISVLPGASWRMRCRMPLSVATM
jgi:hypothetical protein